jgi:hypothetical protein
MKVPPEKVSVHLGSYPGVWRGDPSGRSPGEERSMRSGSSKHAGRNVSETRAGLESEEVDADRSLTARRPKCRREGPKRGPAMVHRGSGNGTYGRLSDATWETRPGAGTQPQRRLGRRSGRESERLTVPKKPGNAGGGKEPHFWVLLKEPKVRGLV